MPAGGLSWSAGFFDANCLQNIANATIYNLDCFEKGLMAKTN